MNMKFENTGEFWEKEKLRADKIKKTEPQILMGCTEKLETKISSVQQYHKGQRLET